MPEQEHATTEQDLPPDKSRRRRWLAGLLSLLVPGLGEVYCGAFRRGLGAYGFFLGVDILAVLALAVWCRPATAMLTAGTTIAVRLMLAARAWRLARRRREHCELKSYNHWYFYLALALVGIALYQGAGLSARHWLVECYFLPTGAMFPTVVRGDRVLANKTAYWFTPVRRGDMVAFRRPNGDAWLQRVVALGGDTIAIRDDCLIVNGQALEQEVVDQAVWQLKVDWPGAEQPPLAGPIAKESIGGRSYTIFLGDDPRDYGKNLDEVTVPQGCLFLLGDNRHASFDSRGYGPIEASALIGRVDCVFWPPRRWQVFP